MPSCNVLFLCFVAALHALLINGQIQLPTIPTSACVGNQLATATYSTQLNLKTGESNELAGSFWNQSGAIWTFSTDTNGVVFDLPSIANISIGGNQKAITQNKNGSSWTLTVPNSLTNSQQLNITFKASAASAAGKTSTAKATATTRSCSKSRAKREAGSTGTPTLNSAKFRPEAGQFALKVLGTWACLQTPSALPPNPSVTKSPALASMCFNNEISAVSESWTSYGVATYMSSLLASAAPTPGSQVDGALVMHSDVNPPGPFCTYTSKCDSITCSDVKDYADGTELAVQRFLGYQAIVNVNNYMNAIMVAVMDAGTINSLMDGKIVTTFFTNPTPTANWEQITSSLTPILGMLSSLLGQFVPYLSPILTGISNLLGKVTSDALLSQLKPVVDKRFTEFATVSDFVATFLKTTVVGIESAYNRTIGVNATAYMWAGSDTGYFASGLWVDSDHTQDLATNLLDDFIRIFTYKVINFAFRDSGCFIIYVPYGVAVHDLNGNMLEDGIDQNYCETQLQNKDHLGNLTICDAPGGMARIINAGALSHDEFGDLTGSLISGLPQGWDTPFAVLPDEYFTIAGAIRGSINSWKTGDFDYDASQPYQATFTSDGAGLTIEQARAIAAMPINEETAGFFNLPVCGTFDLRTFPPASGTDETVCMGNAFGGMANSKNKFSDHVSDTVKNTLLYGPPRDVYGPTIQAPNAAGYMPGWCGVHVRQYQKNEGPGTDTSLYRWSVRIYDGQSMAISKDFAALHEAPNGQWVEFPSLLPSPLRIMPGAVDADPPRFSYPGNADWSASDHSHYCNFNPRQYSDGHIDMDCGFTCA